MKTVIFILGAAAQGVQDREIRAAVEQAGRATLLIDSANAIRGSGNSITPIVREHLVSFALKKGAPASWVNWDLSWRSGATIWVLDARGLTERDIKTGLTRLRSEIFDLPQPPQAIVFETHSATHVGLLDGLQDICGLNNRQQTLLKRAARQTWRAAMILRVAGVRGLRVTRKLGRLHA
ncbi:MAG: hypothetical protein ACXWH0_12655 [Acidimicrobiia bacterium]